MVSTHMFSAVSAVLFLFSTLAQSKNLLRSHFDDAVTVHHGKIKLIRPLVHPPVFVQQSPPGFKPPTQEVCDEVAEMAKGEMELEESTCDAVIYGASAKTPMGCECHFLGEKIKCPWAAPNAGVTKVMQDKGFNRLDVMGKNAGPGSGSWAVMSCMYMAYRDPFPHSVEDGKILQQEDHDDVLYMIKTMQDSTEGARTFENHVHWAGTIPPWPVDEYGTPNCFGRCTTNPPNVWLRYTTTAAPEFL